MVTSPLFRCALILGLLAGGEARAHASEQGFVLLLPTGHYIAGGVAAVALTVAVLVFLPGRAFAALVRPRVLWPMLPGAVAWATGWLSAAALAGLVWIGAEGPTDPLRNLLPLAVWTLWWVGLVSLQGIFGDLWRFLDPLAGPARAIRLAVGWRTPFRLPRRVAGFVAPVLFLCLVAFLLADPTPTDPGRLAHLVAFYFAASLCLTLLFGPRWRVTGEVVTVLMRLYGRVGMFGRRGGRVAIGLWGWQLAARPAVTGGQALFILFLLGSGSFDGLNETFWWFGLIGVNPLDFPGRSALVGETLAGLLAFNVGLVAFFAASVWAGERLASGGPGFRAAFRTLAPSILPIALGYHVGHYLTAFLVDAQYALAAASDPLGRGDDLLGLGRFYVTTGFFNTRDSARAIWLAQAGAVVAGHVLAVLAAHGLALRLHPEPRRAALSQAPLAVFMVLYTLFGLWLLASPRG